MSSSSAFHKKSKVPICTNCVNKKLVDHRKEKQQKEKEEEQSTAQAILEQSRKYVDTAQLIR